MARYKNGVNGPFSGKVGCVVGAARRGTPYFRSVPYFKNNTASQAQLDQRMIFALLMGWLKPLRELIMIGYQDHKAARTPMNGCLSYHLKNALIGEAPNVSIDFAKAIFSRGELMISVVKEAVLEDGMIRITWDNAAPNMLNSDDDLATFVVYNVAAKKFVVYKDQAERSAKEAVLVLPTGVAGELHCWMQYTSQNGERVSTTVYVSPFLCL